MNEIKKMMKEVDEGDDGSYFYKFSKFVSQIYSPIQTFIDFLKIPFIYLSIFLKPVYSYLGILYKYYVSFVEQFFAWKYALKSKIYEPFMIYQ